MELRRAGRDSAVDRPQCHVAAAAHGADGIHDAASGMEEMRVLAVDDNSIDRKLIEMLLKTSSFKGIKTSFKVTAVQDGMQALELLGLTGADSPPRQRLEYDLIMTDYCMPEITGYELLRRIKHESSIWKHVPVVIMSSEKKPARVARCMAEGAQEFLIKPVKLADVQRLKGYVQHLKDTRGDIPSSPTACSSKRKSSASASLPPQRLRRTGLGELIVS